MGIKSFLKELVPPIIVKMVKGTTPQAEEVKLTKYETYNDALKDCTQDAYEAEELINVIFKKTKKLAQEIEFNNTINISHVTANSLVAFIYPLTIQFPKERVIKIIDFGGACGAHYFQIRAFLKKEIKLLWMVVETPAMVKFAKSLENEELKFTISLTEAKKQLGDVDLVHSSGTLQCVDNSFKYLNELIGLNAKWLFFGRLGLNKKDRDVITIHTSKLSWNGVGELPAGHEDKWIKYPFTFLAEKKFFNILNEKYKIISTFDDNSGIYSIIDEEIMGCGMLYERVN